MAKQYYIKKDPAVSGPDVEWTAINGKEFYQFITSPAGRGRYFIDMDDFMIEANETEYAEWRKEKNHSDYLRSQENNEFANLHLQILTGLSKKLVHEDFRNSLKDAASADEIYDLLKKFEEEMNV